MNVLERAIATHLQILDDEIDRGAMFLGLALYYYDLKC